jgi:hypothetical protein
MFSNMDQMRGDESRGYPYGCVYDYGIAFTRFTNARNSTAAVGYVSLYSSNRSGK